MPPRPDSPEQRLNDIVSTVGDWIWETNEILELSFISDRFKQTTGLAPESLKGKTLQQVVLADESAGKDNPVLFTLDHREPFHDIACSIISAGGEVLHFTLSGIPYYSENHMFKGYRGAAHNITQQLETQRKYYEALGPQSKQLPQRPQLAELSPVDALNRAAQTGSMNEAFVIYDQNGKIVAASEGYAKLYPAVSDMLLSGASLKDILTEAAKRLEIKEAAGRLDDWVAEKLDERLHPKPVHHDIFRGGRWWRIHEQRTQGGQVLSLHTDVTAIRDMEASLLDAETRYRRLIELAPDLTCVVTDGVITLMNSAGATMLKAESPKDLVGNRFNTYLHNDFRNLLNASLAELMGEQWMPVRLLRTDGVAIDADLAVLPFNERGLRTIMLVARDTSDRNRAARVLISRDEQLQGILATVVDGIITIDTNGIVQSFNKAAEKIFGYRAHEVIDKNVKMLMPEPYRAEHDGYLNRYDKTRAAHIIGKGREVQGKRKDGSVFPMDLAVSELKRGNTRLFTGVVRDISERKQAEAELNESRERFELAINGAGEGIWDWNIQEDRLYISSKIREMTGYKTNIIKPSSWIKLIHPDDRAEYRKRLVAHLKGNAPDFTAEYRLINRSGTERWIRISGMALRDRAGWVYRMAGSVGDITEKMEFERELIRAKDRAEIANRVKTEFLANMSHELRTPLNAIIGFSDVMLSNLFGALEPRYRDYIENIRDSGAHLLAVINDILDVSRIEAGRMDLRPERTNPAELIDSAIRLIRDRAHEQSLSLTRRISKGLPDILVDQQRMKQVLLNLLSNAVKFT
ncbi:MAG TPA: PAS domain S-box protein, partial [Magnetovibrio sp.]